MAVEPTLNLCPSVMPVSSIAAPVASGANEEACVCGFDVANVFVRLRCSLACAAEASAPRFSCHVVTPRLMSDS